MDAAYGQFHTRYLWENIKHIFFAPVKLLPTGELDFPMFSGFMFYVANPIFIVWFVRLIKDIRRKRVTRPMAAACLGLAVNLFLLCLHKSFGGYQFGARYTLDLIPHVLFYLLLSGRYKPMPWERFLCGFGLLFNAYGTITMHLIQ